MSNFDIVISRYRIFIDIGLFNFDIGISRYRRFIDIGYDMCLRYRSFADSDTPLSGLRAAFPGCCSVLDTDCSVVNSLHINWRSLGSCNSARPSLSTGDERGRRRRRHRRLPQHCSRRRRRWHQLQINSRFRATSLARSSLAPPPPPSPRCLPDIVLSVTRVTSSEPITVACPAGE